jgi:hypothetical protein
MVVCNSYSIPSELPDTTIRKFVYFDNKDKLLNDECFVKFRKYAESGLYAQVMSSFIGFLLKNFVAYKKKVEKNVVIYEQRAAKEFEKAGLKPHFRCVNNLALMMVAMALFNHLALKNNAITSDECSRLNSQAWDNLVTLMLDQKNIIDNSSVGSDFIREIKAALRNGKAHLQELKTGGIPNVSDTDLESVGWNDNDPQGEFIGWIDTKNECVYISHEIPIKTLKSLLRKGTASKLSDSEKSFWIMLKNDKALGQCDKGGNRKKIKNPTTGIWGNERPLKMRFNFFKEVVVVVDDDDDEW